MAGHVVDRAEHLIGRALHNLYDARIRRNFESLPREKRPNGRVKRRVSGSQTIRDFLDLANGLRRRFTRHTAPLDLKLATRRVRAQPRAARNRGCVQRRRADQ